MPKSTVYVVIERGLVEHVLCNDKDINVSIIDLDAINQKTEKAYDQALAKVAYLKKALPEIGYDTDITMPDDIIGELFLPDPDQVVMQFKDEYLFIKQTNDGWNWSIYHAPIHMIHTNKNKVRVGEIRDPKLSLLSAVKQACIISGLNADDMQLITADKIPTEE